jgi:hypothetical protein
MTSSRIPPTCPRCFSSCTGTPLPGWVRCLVCNFEGPIVETVEEKAKMMAESNIEISEVRFTAAPPRDTTGGFLGFVDFVLCGELKISGIALRRTRQGDLRLSFPAKRDSSGQERYFIRPIRDGARLSLERQVIAALGHQVGQPCGRLSPTTKPGPQGREARLTPEREVRP